MFYYIQENRDRDFLLRVSFLEIYNEVISDLLDSSRTNLKLVEHAGVGPYCKDATETVCSSVEDVMQVIHAGETARTVA